MIEETKHINILHLEDNSSDAELIKIELESIYTDFNLDQASNRKDFIEYLKKGNYDVIISDYNLPDIEGVEIFDVAKEYFPNIPFIFISGTIGEERAVEVLRYGVTDYVLKSNLGKLSYALNRALEEVHQIKEKQIAETALKKSEIFKTAILDSLSAHIAVLNASGKIISVNKAWNKFATKNKFNTSELDSINYLVYLSNFLTEKEAKIIYSGIMDVIQQKVNYFYYDYHIKNINGQDRWYTLRANSIASESGAVVSHTNITDRKEAENLLMIREERFRGLIENSSEITFIVDKNGVILYISPSIKKLMGYNGNELLDQKIFEYIHPDDKTEAINLLITKHQGTSPDEYNIYRFVTKRNKHKHLRLMITNHLDTKSINGFIINAQDVTELVKSQQEKHFAIIKTEENERHRISNDLHDGLGQTIAAANMCINTLEPLAKQQLDAKAYSIFETGKKLINDSAKETRLVSHNIMPRSLREFGLYSCIYGVLKSYQEFYQSILFNIDSNIKDNRYTEEIELSIFRVAQESINNAIKHSKASTITVVLNEDKNELVLSIIDNGIGFNTKELKDRGLGLTSINQRIKALGGKVTIKSKPSKGTTIFVKLLSSVN